jgi:4-amino-4-deoxy-L-arabinose transferase-like glycosyltransferase
MNSRSASGGAGTSGSTDPWPRKSLLWIVLVAVAVRAAIGVWAVGRGEMEGLAWRYHQDALAIVAGYGISRPLESRPPQVNLIALADSLARRAERVSPARVPPKDPALWRPSALHPPGYALFLALVYRVFGDPLFVWAKSLQALLDALACLAVFAIGRRFVGTRAGLIAAWGYALFLPIAYQVTSRVADALVPPLTVFAFLAFVRALDTGRARAWVRAGLVLGVICLLRPDMLLLPAFLLPVVMARPGRRVATAIGVAGMVATAFLVLLPWGIRNQRALGSFQIASLAGGVSLFQSVGQFPNPYGIIFTDEASTDTARSAGFEGLDDPGADRYFKRRFATIVREDPGLIASEIVKRIPLGIVPLYHWGYDNPGLVGGSFYDYVNRDRISAYQAMLRHPLAVLGAYWDRLLFGLIAFGLFVAGIALIVSERSAWPTALLLQTPYLYLYLSHLPIVLGARLLVPGVFGQLVILGYWIQRLVLRLPTRLEEI